MLRCFQIALLLASLAFPAAAETLVQAVSRAIQYFPEIQAAQSRREVASAQTGQARAEFFPSANVFLGEGRETSRNASTRVLGGDPTLTRREADLSVSQLIFDGGATGGQVRRFGAVRLPQLAAYARASTDVAEAYRLQFQLGQRSLLDVLNAENERFNAVSGYIAGRAAVTVDELRLLASAGRLLEALGIAVPQQQQAETER